MPDDELMRPLKVGYDDSIQVMEEMDEAISDPTVLPYYPPGGEGVDFMRVNSAADAFDKTTWFVRMVHQERAKAEAAGEPLGPPPTGEQLKALASWAISKEPKEAKGGLGADPSTVATGMTTGAAAGAGAGPWGAAIGAGVGLISSLFGKADKSAQLAKQVANRQLAAAQTQAAAQRDAAKLTVEAETIKAQAGAQKMSTWIKLALIGGGALLIGGGALFLLTRKKKGT